MESSGTNLLSVREITRVYRLTKYTIYTLIKTDPTFPCINIGPRKNYRIPSDRFNAWLEQKLKERHYSGFNIPTPGELYNLGRS